mgnify:CR=1 FL=1
MSESTATDDSIRDTVRAVLAEHPVAVGFLFGSHAREEATPNSDIDVAVAFEDRSAADTATDDQRLALSTDLAVALGTDDVDVVDLRAATPGLVRAVFSEGTRLIGSEQDARDLRERLLAAADNDPRSPAERFDDALAALDDHLA